MKLNRKLLIKTKIIFLILCGVGVWLYKQNTQRFLSNKDLWQQTRQFLFPKAPQFDKRQLKMADFGRRLFHDPRLSLNSEVSCATCHNPEQFFTDRLKTSKGIDVVEKNAPTIINSFMQDWFFWDGRADSLASQALQPLESSHEHGFSRTQLARLIAEHYLNDYETLFDDLNGQELSRLENKPLVPKSVPIQLSPFILNYAAATLGNVEFANKILNFSQDNDVPPQQTLVQNLFPNSDSNSKEMEAYNSLDNSLKEQINNIFINAALAIAEFERGIISNESAFDTFLNHWNEGDHPEEILSKDFNRKALMGLEIFVGNANCVLCHSGSNFTDNQFHNIGLPHINGQKLDLGRSVGVIKAQADYFNCNHPILKTLKLYQEKESCRELPYLDADSVDALGAFKTPTLRNVEKTFPYMHDGRFQTLEEVLEHYNELAQRPAVGHIEETLKPLNLSAEEKEALLFFLKSLTGPVKDLTRIELKGF